MHFFQKNRLASCCFIAIAAVFLINSYTTKEVYLNDGALHPMTYPRVLLWIWVILSLLYAFTRNISVSIESLLKAFPVILSITAASVSFVVVLPYFGFTVASALLMFTVFCLLRYGSLALRLGASCGCSVGIWLIFQKLLSFPLTTGTLTGF